MMRVSDLRIGDFRGALLGGARFSLSDYLASLSDGVFFDFTKTDRFFQEPNGPTLADDVGELIGLALDSRTWGGRSLAQQLAVQPEMVTNGGFDADVSWTKGAGWTISGGVASNSAPGATSNLSQNDGLVAGRLYEVTFTSIVSAGTVAVYTGTTFGGGFSVSGTYTRKIIAAGTGNLTFQANAAFVGSIDNVSCKLVPGNHATQSTGTMKPSRQTAGVLGDGSDDNLLTTYSAGAASNFIVALVTIPASIAATQVIFGASAPSADRFYIAVNTSGRVYGGLGSQAIAGSIDLRNTEVVVGISADGSTVKIFADATEEYSGAQSGVPTTSIACRIHAFNNNGTAANFFGGNIKKLIAGRDALTLSKYQQIRTALLAA